LKGRAIEGRSSEVTRRKVDVYRGGQKSLDAEPESWYRSPKLQGSEQLGMTHKGREVISSDDVIPRQNLLSLAEVS
jgi:hypothetical protein